MAKGRQVGDRDVRALQQSLDVVKVIFLLLQKDAIGNAQARKQLNELTIQFATFHRSGETNQSQHVRTR